MLDVNSAAVALSTPRTSPEYCSNMLLRGMPVEVLSRLWPQLELVPLQAKHLLHHPDTPIDNIYFIETGLISVVAQAGGRKGVGTWLIGREGLMGIPAILGEQHPNHRRIVQVGGYALRMRADALLEAMDQISPLRGLLLYYVQVVLAQAAQLSACNSAHAVQQRMARWLLMAQDRCESDVLPITHDMLARMLGVRRATVTNGIMSLEEAGILARARSRIKIVDRAKLKAMSCICYSVVRDADRRLRDKCNKSQGYMLAAHTLRASGSVHDRRYRST